MFQVSYPSPIIIQNGAVLLCNEADYSYQWFLNGIAIDSAISQFYIPIESGSYQVSTTDFNNYCEVISDSLLYNFVGVEEQHASIKIFPNPSSDATLSKLSSETVVNIYNARGLLLNTKNTIWNK